MKTGISDANGSRPARLTPSCSKVPRPLGATVELRHATGTEPELLRHRAMLQAVASVEFPYPAIRFAGRGVVICGGGVKYLPSVYVLVRLLRHLRCWLPIEVWHLGKKEMPDEIRGLLATYGAACVDAEQMRRVHPVRRLGGWELKCYALLHSKFAEVLLLDADNCPVRNPDFLFRTRQYAEHGAIFWPDYTRFAKGQAVWVASGIPYRDEPEFESGQIVVDKARCWKTLNVAMHLNEHSEWWYRVVHGDKDTFHLAWRKLGQSYAMPGEAVGTLEATMLQYDFAGRLLFQHRNFAKWTLDENRRIPGFRLERECLGFLAELRKVWSPGLPPWVRKWERAKAAKPLHAVAARLCRTPLEYVRVGLGSRALAFRADGTIGIGAAGGERWWDLRLVKVAGGTRRTVQLEVFGEKGLTFRARPVRGGGWSGAWVGFQQCKVMLRPIRKGQKRAKKGKTGRPEGRNGENGEKKRVFHVPKRDWNGRELAGDVPKPARKGGKPVREVDKRASIGLAAAGDITAGDNNGSGSVGRMAKRGRSGREPVLAVPKHPANGLEPIYDMPGRRRTAR